MSTDRVLNQPLSGNDMPRFGGPATFMRLPTATALDDIDVGIIGVPFDIGTSNRPGARLAPRQIRDESRMLRPYNMATRAAPFDSLQVADLGDVAINTFNLLKSIDIIEQHYRTHLAQALASLEQASTLAPAHAGAWTQRDSFEAHEVALAMAMPELVGRMEARAAIGTLSQ